MNAKQVFAYALELNLGALKMLLTDMSDEELRMRPARGANPIAWQLGHLISSEVTLAGKIPGYATVDLPPGFVERHNEDSAGSDQTDGFLPKAKYLELYDAVRAATVKAVDKLSEADLDKPSGLKMFPTVGAVLQLIATHPGMHSGQVAVLRRSLGKPIVM